jgi:hypothetical protein
MPPRRHLVLVAGKLGLAARIRADQPTPKMLPSAETRMLLPAETFAPEGLKVSANRNLRCRLILVRRG